MLQTSPTLPHKIDVLFYYLTHMSIYILKEDASLVWEPSNFDLDIWKELTIKSTQKSMNNLPKAPAQLLKKSTCH